MKLGQLESMQPSAIRRTSGLLLVCFGPSGAGKTTLLETLLETPEQYSPLAVLDIDGKAHVLRDSPLIEVYPTHTWPQLDMAVQELEKQSLKPYFKTVCFDGTALMQTASQEHANVFATDNPQLRQTRYGKANMEMIQMASRARVLAERGINVIFNLWSVREKEEDSDLTVILPDLTPALLTRFIGQLDFVVYLECAPPPKPYPPVMRTGGSVKYMTKTAVAPDSPLRNLPSVIYNPSYTSILDAFHGEPWPTERHNKKNA